MEIIIWILLWSSTQSWCGSDYTEQVERYSIRNSSTAIVEWKNMLEKNGKGFNFTILKAEQVYTEKELKK